MLDHMQTRIDLFPGLVNRLAGFDPSTQRRLACDIMRWAVRRTPVDDPRFATGYAALLAGAHRDDGVMSAARAVEAELDEKYLELLPDADDDEHDRQDNAAVLQAFNEARIAGALVAALGEDPLEAVCETLYEVQATIDSQEQLVDLQRHLPDISVAGLRHSWPCVT